MQFIRKEIRFIVVQNQNRDVARVKSRFGAPRQLERPVAQKFGDLLHGHGATLILLRLWDTDDVERMRVRDAVLQQGRRIVRGSDFREIDRRIRERLRVFVENPVDILDHGGGGTIIGRKGVTFSPFPGQLVFRAAVGCDVATTERVDRLARVAHHVERSAGMAEDGGENFILNGIGVLKFIDVYISESAPV